MKKIHFLLIILFLSSVLYVALEFTGNYVYSEYVMALVVPVVCVFYLITCKNKLRYFTNFLVLFSLSHLLTFLGDTSSIHIDLEYYLGNLLYITAYLYLIYGTLKVIPFKNVVPRFNLTIIILLLLNSYVLYTLLSSDFSLDLFLIEPSNSLENNTEENLTPLANMLPSIIIEFVYNLVVLILLNVSFLNYLYRESKRSLFLFIGTLSVVFSEIIQYVIFYPSSVFVLNIICYLLIVLGFLCFYLYATQNSEEDLGIIEL